MLQSRKKILFEDYSDNFSSNINKNEIINEDLCNHKNNSNINEDFEENQMDENANKKNENMINSNNIEFNKENESIEESDKNDQKTINNENPYKQNLQKFLTFDNKINEVGRKLIIQENEKDEEIKPEFKTLLKKKYFVLTLLCCIIFYVCSFIYYGLIYILPQTIVFVDPTENSNLIGINNSTISNNSISTNYSNINNNKQKTINLIEQENEEEMYRGVILSALSEIPSTFLTGYIGNIPFLGRKGSMIYGFILSGISSFLCAKFMKNLTIFATALKFSIGIPFGVIYLYVTEAFPTKIRTISLGVTNSFNRLGGITTPIISQMAFSLQPNNPYKIYSFIAFIAAIFVHLLPFETLGRNIN